MSGHLPSASRILDEQVESGSFVVCLLHLWRFCLALFGLPILNLALVLDGGETYSISLTQNLPIGANVAQLDLYQ